jgi:hypothetical protein
MQALLRSDVPTIGFRGQLASKEFVARFKERIKHAPAPMISLSHPQDLDSALRLVEARGLETGNQVRLELAFFSRLTPFSVIAFEVRPPAGGGQEVIALPEPLPDEAFAAEISALDLPSVFKAGAPQKLEFKVKNVSSSPWPVTVFRGGAPSLRLANHWLDPAGAVLVNDDGRAPISIEVKPGEETQVSLTVTAPPTPGRYILEIDMLQELVAWFASKGSKTLRIEVTVE